MFRKWGLSFKLIFFISTVVVLIFLVVVGYNYQISKKLLIKNVEESITNLAQSAVNEIENILIPSMKLSEYMAFLIEDNDYTKQQLKELMVGVVEENEEVFGSCIAFEHYAYDKSTLYFAPYVYKFEDTIKCELLGSDSYQYFYWDWFQIPKELHQPIWSEPYFDEGGGKIIMSTYSVPFYKNNKFSGVVTVDISLQWLKHYVSNLKILESGYAFLISRNGTIITHPNEDYIMNESIFSIAEEANAPEIRNIGKHAQQGGTDFLPFRSIFLKEKSYLYYTPLPSNKWALAIIVPEDELLADLHQLNTDLLLIGIAGLLLLIITVALIASRITNPLRRLAHITQDIGGGNFNVNLPETKSNDEIARLNKSIKRMQDELQDYFENLKETTAAKEKIESELKIAHDIQQGIIPKIFPPFPEREEIDLYAILDPARDVGGDLYDFFFIDNDHICFAIGDVSGKGVPASLLMAITRTLFRSKIIKVEDVSKYVSSINLELCRDNENAMFVTFFLGIINLKTGKLSYCNAGHNYPYILKPSGEILELSETHGTPLGLFDDMKYGESEIVLGKGDLVVMYTDGVTEALDIDNKLYGDQRLKKIIASHKEGKIKKLTLAIVKDVKDFAGNAEQSDDITIMTLRYH